MILVRLVIECVHLRASHARFDVSLHHLHDTTCCIVNLSYHHTALIILHMMHDSAHLALIIIYQFHLTLSIAIYGLVITLLSYLSHNTLSCFHSFKHRFLILHRLDEFLDAQRQWLPT